MPATDPYAQLGNVVSTPSDSSGGGDPYAQLGIVVGAAQPAAANDADPAPVLPQGDGDKANAIAGFVQAVTGLPDAINRIFNPGSNLDAVIMARDPRIIAAAKARGITPTAAAQGVVGGYTAEHALDQGLGAATGYNPEGVVAATPEQRVARGVGAGAAGLLFPGAEGYAPIEAFGNAVTGGVAGGASAAAQEYAPDELKPVVGTAAGVVAGLATHGAGMGARAALGAAGDATAPFAANVSEGAAKTAAGKVVAANATDVGAVKASLDQPGEIVSGSKPTTFQQTGDAGLGSLERTAATRDPTPFVQRRADQGVARTTALQDVQSGGDPNELAASLRGHFDDLDQQTQGAVDQATSGAQAATAAAGGGGNPEDYGTQVRGALSAADQASGGAVSKLYDAVDPNRDMTGNMATTRSAATAIQGEMRPTAKPMEGEEAAIFDAAQSLPTIAPAADLLALKQRVNAAASAEMRASGSTPVYARLSQLRGAINQNLADTIAQRVADDDAAVSRGTMAPEDAMGVALQREVDAFKSQRTAARTGSGGQTGTVAGGRSAVVSSDAGAEVPQAGGFGDSAGNPSVSSSPTFDAEAAERLSAADAAYAEHAKTYDAAPVGQTLRTTGYKGDWALPNGKVASAFFHPGPTGYDDMQALYRASNPATVNPIIGDYAATSLRRSAMDDKGVIDPAKYQAWSKAHQDALRALPDDVRAKFATAAQAGQAVAEATGNRVLALKQAQQGAIGKVMGATTPEDVTRNVAAILRSKNAGRDMLQLAQATKGDKEAVAGLRQAVADHITGQLIGNTEAGASGVSQIKADAFQTFMKNSRPALNVVFKPEEVASMEAIAQDIQRAKRSDGTKAVAGPGTAQDLVAAGKKHGTGHAIRTGVIDLAGMLLGHHFGGEVGMLAGGAGAQMLQSMRAAGVSKIDQLVTTAMLHPDVAKALLAKVPTSQAGQMAVSHQLSRALYRVLPAVGASSRQNGKSQ